MPSIIAFENTFVNGVKEKTKTHHFTSKYQGRQQKIDENFSILGLFPYWTSDMSHDKFLISTMQLIVAAQLPKITGIMEQLQCP